MTELRVKARSYRTEIHSEDKRDCSHRTHRANRT